MSTDLVPLEGDYSRRLRLLSLPHHKRRTIPGLFGLVIALMGKYHTVLPELGDGHTPLPGTREPDDEDSPSTQHLAPSVVPSILDTGEPSESYLADLYRHTANPV